MLFKKNKRNNRKSKFKGVHTCIWEPVEEYYPERMVVYHNWECTLCGKRELIGVEELEEVRK